MGVAPVALYAAKGMFANGLSSFVIPGVLFDVIVIYIYCILVFTALDYAFGKFGALMF